MRVQIYGARTLAGVLALGDMHIDHLRLELFDGEAAQVAPVKVMLASISDRQDLLAVALAFDPLVDYLWLDTSRGLAEDNPVHGWVGVTGKTHDWSVSRAIVQGCGTPVILARGLNAG